METLQVETNDTSMMITLDRPASKNAINVQLLNELNEALNGAEKNDQIRTVLIKGNKNFFCTGMDFKEALQNKEEEKIFASRYGQTLKRLTTIPKIIVSLCEGKVMAGGVGFAAASDIVIAGATASFCLSEVIWGLLPANVLPYLIRRTGFQPAYFMTITTNTITAEEAKKFHLVDILAEEPEKDFQKLNRRLSLMHPKTIAHLKSYFRKLWIINESTEDLAINTLAELKSDPLVLENIRNYVDHGKLPWD